MPSEDTVVGAILYSVLTVALGFLVRDYWKTRESVVALTAVPAQIEDMQKDITEIKGLMQGPNARLGGAASEGAVRALEVDVAEIRAVLGISEDSDGS